MRKSNIYKTTYTGLLLALLIVLQWSTAPLGQFVTGSLVNFILIMSAITCGILSGSFIAIVSPFLAFAFGIGPKFVILVPFISLANLALVISYSLFFKKGFYDTFVKKSITVIASAVIKFLVIYISIVKIALPFLATLNEVQRNVMTIMFSYPQLITAIIGGIIASIVYPLVKDYIKM